jgi:hypothetical protein
MDEEFSQMDNEIFKEWRQLGFYYELYENGDVCQWRFFGSKSGFQQFSSLLCKYADDPVNVNFSEHEHYGPYYYLKIMTSDQERITADMFEVTIQGARQLADIILRKTMSHAPGETFLIETEFGNNNTASALFFLMDDSFDPASLDKSLRRKLTGNSKDCR